ncbi:hypothetical protein AKJ16_DCAP25443, partial [Drosera capensis]
SLQARGETTKEDHEIRQIVTDLALAALRPFRQRFLRMWGDVTPNPPILAQIAADEPPHSPPLATQNQQSSSTSASRLVLTVLTKSHDLHRQISNNPPFLHLHCRIGSKIADELVPAQVVSLQCHVRTLHARLVGALSLQVLDTLMIMLMTNICYNGGRYVAGVRPMYIVTWMIVIVMTYRFRTKASRTLLQAVLIMARRRSND